MTSEKNRLLTGSGNREGQAVPRELTAGKAKGGSGEW